MWATADLKVFTATSRSALRRGRGQSAEECERARARGRTERTRLDAFLRVNGPAPAEPGMAAHQIRELGVAAVVSGLCDFVGHERDRLRIDGLEFVRIVVGESARAIAPRMVRRVVPAR